MIEQAGDMLVLMVSVDSEVGDQVLLCQQPCLWEAVHAFVHLEEH